ncbi:hypothetical protein Emin_1544 [Elusimicrobium minutum Pei191]|uniref:Uncharacterized protein n=1 Tax=Elusimicrobium minutum (strain Pei191) TaxID=445932 RepID=B2KEZ5_ELUMP|nr:hypothetical protein [Elusimicrobium minutum]ACC99091.1 hypothetical protein Emin_1544 [Elusimicrobium minutum Pei191]
MSSYVEKGHASLAVVMVKAARALRKEPSFRWKSYRITKKFDIEVSSGKNFIYNVDERIGPYLIAKKQFPAGQGQ